MQNDEPLAAYSDSHPGWERLLADVLDHQPGPQAGVIGPEDEEDGERWDSMS